MHTWIINLHLFVSFRLFFVLFLSCARLLRQTNWHWARENELQRRSECTDTSPPRAMQQAAPGAPFSTLSTTFERETWDTKNRSRPYPVSPYLSKNGFWSTEREKSKTFLCVSGLIPEMRLSRSLYVTLFRKCHPLSVSSPFPLLSITLSFHLSFVIEKKRRHEDSTESTLKHLVINERQSFLEDFCREEAF